LALASAATGLTLVVKAYPDGDPIRDAAHAALLERVRSQLPSGTPWRTEVAMPIPGDLRAWDAVAALSTERVAFEAETHLSDLQAQTRRWELKIRDGGVGIVVLAVADTAHNRRVLRLHRESLRGLFPLDGRGVLMAIRSGSAPAANGIVVL
jgi:hypothetical protein